MTLWSAQCCDRSRPNATAPRKLGTVDALQGPSVDHGLLRDAVLWVQAWSSVPALVCSALDPGCGVQWPGCIRFLEVGAGMRIVPVHLMVTDGSGMAGAGGLTCIGFWPPSTREASLIRPYTLYENNTISSYPK